MEPQAECWVKWEINLSPAGAARVALPRLRRGCLPADVGGDGGRDEMSNVTTFSEDDNAMRLRRAINGRQSARIARRFVLPTGAWPPGNCR